MRDYREVKQVKDRHQQELLSLPGVVGVGIGQDPEGQFCLTVHLTSKIYMAALPEAIEGIKVQVLEVGEVRLF